MGFSFIYAFINYLRRRELQNNLDTHVPNTPWFFKCDFNAIISDDEYKASHSPSRAPMNDFFNQYDKNHSTHIPIVDNKQTWSNGGKGKHLTQKRLNIVFCNVDWLDACSIVVCITLTKIKFLKTWALNKECVDIIIKSWMTKVSGFPMYILDEQLRILKDNLKVWDKNNFCNIKTKVIEVEQVLKDFQFEIDTRGLNDIMQAKEKKA